MSYVPAPGYMPTYNPPLPYNKFVPGGLRPGMSIYVQGTVPHHTKRFRVNFACGPEDGADIALHFNPRFDGKDKVVLNTFERGKWGREEVHSMPLHKGKQFEIIFVVNNDGYQLMVNRNPFCNFGHRIPPERVQVVSADGDLELQSLTLMGGAPMPGGGMPPQSFPQMGMPIHRGVGDAAASLLPGSVPVRLVSGSYDEKEEEEDEKEQPVTMVGMMPDFGYGPSNLPGIPNYGYGPTNLPVMTAPTSYHPQVPYVGNLPGGLGSKRTIILRGFIPQDAKKFHINFKAGPQDIILHINPRMDERAVVRNSYLNGRWGPEERELTFNPFQRGQYFDLSIRCGNQRFKVFANDQHLFDFNHRFQNFQQINMLEIAGDVVLSYIQY